VSGAFRVYTEVTSGRTKMSVQAFLQLISGLEMISLIGLLRRITLRNGLDIEGQ
jgi:hypothetical protein